MEKDSSSASFPGLCSGQAGQAGRLQRAAGRNQTTEDRGKLVDCRFEIDEVSVFRFQILCFFFLTPET
jgi:hypothetical protein